VRAVHDDISSLRPTSTFFPWAFSVHRKFQPRSHYSLNSPTALRRNVEQCPTFNIAWLNTHLAGGQAAERSAGRCSNVQRSALNFGQTRYSNQVRQENDNYDALRTRVNLMKSTFHRQRQKVFSCDGYGILVHRSGTPRKQARATLRKLRLIW